MLVLAAFIHERTNSAILRHRFSLPVCACTEPEPDERLLNAIASDSRGLVLVLGADNDAIKAAVHRSICDGHPTAYIEAPTEPDGRSPDELGLDSWLQRQLGLAPSDVSAWYDSLPADMPQVKLVLAFGDRLFIDPDIQPWLISMAEKSVDEFHHPFKTLLFVDDAERFRQVCAWNGGTKISGLNLSSV